MKNKENWGLTEPKISKSKSKNGKYVAEFQYWKENGTKGHTNTRSFSTPKRAIQMAKEKQRESANRSEEKQTDLTKKTICQAMDDYMVYLQDKLEIETYENTSGLQQYLDDIKAIKNNYVPSFLKDKKIFELEDEDFGLWIDYINNVDVANKVNGLSGSRVQSYRRALKDFIDFLSKKQYFLFDRTLKKTLTLNLYEPEIKTKEDGKRKDVYVPDYLDLQILCRGYDRATFSQEYCYVLFKFLFYSGIRICEALALQWKNVNFESGLIYIKQSINQKEKRKNVNLRIRKNIKKTKNRKSERYIPMMEVYYKLFKNYKYNYMKHFNLSEEALAEAYCFPKLQSRYKNKDDKGPYVYQTQKWLQAEVKRACEKTGIENFPPESFRHACAIFYKNELHILESEAFDLFGHTDSEMLKEVYGDKSAETTAKRIAKRQRGLFYINQEYENRQREIFKEKLKQFEKGEKLENEFFREQFLATKSKIEHLIEKDIKFYTYNSIEEPIIDRLIKQFNFDEEMTFIKEEE